MAFPLQIPQNSELEQKINEYQISYKEDDFYVKSVASSSSFTKEDRDEMDQIAFTLSYAEKPIGMIREYLSKIEHTQYQYELNLAYFRDCGKLTEPMVFNFGNVSCSLNYQTIMEDIAAQYIYQCIWHARISKNEAQPQRLLHKKIVFGESGHFYIYSEFPNDVHEKV